MYRIRRALTSNKTSKKAANAFDALFDVVSNAVPKVNKSASKVQSKIHYTATNLLTEAANVLTGFSNVAREEVAQCTPQVFETITELFSDVDNASPDLMLKRKKYKLQNSKSFIPLRVAALDHWLYM